MWTCPQCSFRTRLPLDLCPECHCSLVVLGRSWASPRRAPRVPVHPPARCEVNGKLEAAVLDVSPLGARIEHRETLRPGQPYLLTIPLVPDGPPRPLPARVVWSFVHRFEPRRDEKGLIFHSGVEFRNLTPTVERDLAAYVGSLGGSRPDPGPGAEASPPD